MLFGPSSDSRGLNDFTTQPTRELIARLFVMPFVVTQASIERCWKWVVKLVSSTHDFVARRLSILCKRIVTIVAIAIRQGDTKGAIPARSLTLRLYCASYLSRNVKLIHTSIIASNGCINKAFTAYNKIVTPDSMVEAITLHAKADTQLLNV